MKNIKKIFVALVCFVSSGFAFAVEDSLSMFQKIGNDSRQEFENEIETTDVEMMMLASLENQGLVVKDFVRIYDESMDEEDFEVLEWLDEKICKEASENDEFVGMVFRNIDYVNLVFDGWVSLSHFINESDIEHYLYYFSCGM